MICLLFQIIMVDLEEAIIPPTQKIGKEENGKIVMILMCQVRVDKMFAVQIAMYYFIEEGMYNFEKLER